MYISHIQYIFIFCHCNTCSERVDLKRVFLFVVHPPDKCITYIINVLEVFACICVSKYLKCWMFLFKR